MDFRSSPYRYFSDSIPNEQAELETKIQNKFIRNIVKPYPVHIPKKLEDDNAVQQQIPSSSSLYHHTPFPLKTQIQSNPPPQQPLYEQPPPIKQQPPLRIIDYCPPINCVIVSDHVKQCPVCSQIYRPYTGVMLTIIIILVVVILFLLKKILQF